MLCYFSRFYYFEFFQNQFLLKSYDMIQVLFLWKLGENCFKIENKINLWKRTPADEELD
jgi:hypothetical protein